MSRTFRRTSLVLSLLVIVSSFVSGQDPIENGNTVTDTARRVIHLESYQPTPGDVYTLSINYGFNFETRSAAATENIELILNSDYTLDVPFVGELNVRTLDYNELREQVTARVSDRAFAQFVSLNLTYPAVFDVLIWGGVDQPGFHAITSLTRLSEAVATAGTTGGIGSRRQVKLTRSGRTVSYDLLRYVTEGDEDQNPFLKPGDRVHVPVADASVQVRGAVVRPGTVEVLPGETVGDVLMLAGGQLPTAQPEKIAITRIGEGNRYAILDLSNVDVTTAPVSRGDIITIPSSTTTTELVQIEGAIYTAPAEEGTPRAIPMQPVLLDVPYTPGMTVLGVLERFGGPTPFADTERSFIIRSGSGERSPVPDLGDVWKSRQWDRDISLEPGDKLVIPMRRLVVSVGGQVNRAGGFGFTSGYSVADYIELAGGIREQDGSVNRVYFAEPDGALTRVDLDTAVPPGTNIYVGRSGWGEAQRLFGNVFTVTGWVTGIIGVATIVIQFIQLFNPSWP